MATSHSSATTTMAVALRASSTSASDLLRSARGARKEDHALGVPWYLLEALDQLGLPIAGPAGDGDGGPHAEIKLLAKRLDECPLLLGDLYVALGKDNLAVTRLETKKLHQTWIMANPSGKPKPLQVEDVDRSRAAAHVTKTVRDGVTGQSPSGPSRL
jgi:hypothetical protein